MPFAATELELVQIRADIEANTMPYTGEVRTVSTTPDSLGKGINPTHTTTDTVSCGIRQLAGRELEVAQGIAQDTTHRIRVPYGTEVTPTQEFYWQEKDTTFNILWVDKANLLETPLLAQQLTR